MAAPEVRRLVRVSLNVGDLKAACAFYVEVLGFRQEIEAAGSDDGLDELLGLAAGRMRRARLRLGAEELELVAFDPAGGAYPTPRRACDPWFQHVAIVVADMPAAYSRLESSPMAAISTGGPQRLPPSTGSIIAFKFRDPEGHPLELSYFPEASAAARWRNPPSGQVFLGLDHSAIAVTDVARSEAFYVEGLGLSVGARLINSGATQARLDGMDAPVVDIVTLFTAETAGPHIELLGYRGETGSTRASPHVDDAAATRLVFKVAELDALLERLPPGARASPIVCSDKDQSRAVLLLDPDGHRLILSEPAVIRP